MNAPENVEPADLEGLLREGMEILHEAKAMPLSNSVLVNREDLLELFEEAVAILPEEIRQARWLLREREEYLERTRKEGEHILEAARERAERIVSRAELVKEAEHRAERLLSVADEDARRMRHEADDYCDQKLAAFEQILARLTGAVKAGRDRLSALPGRDSDDLSLEPVTEAGGAPEADANSALFDQDYP